MLERIYVEIGNVCNLACAFCTGTKRPAKQMTEEEFSFICERIRYHTKYIYFHVMGEPLLHPGLGAFLSVAKDKGLPVCITTNGTLLKEKADVLLQNATAIHKVSVSLHAVEGNGREADGDYMNTVTDFAEKASELDVYTVFRLWNEDSEEGRGQHEQNEKIEAHLRKVFPSEWQFRPRGYRLAKNIFLEYDGIFTWPTDSRAAQVTAGFCHALSSQIAILADGTVTPCCLDAEGEMPLGNIFESTLEEILSSKRASAMRDGFAKRTFVEPLCQRCTFARKFKK